MIFQQSRIEITQSVIITIDCEIIRSILEYACSAWHSGLTTALSEDIERVQKRCMRIVYPHLSYNYALFVSKLERVSVRRGRITRDKFKDIQK